MAGNLLDEQAGAELASGALESVLARLDAPPEPKQVAAAPVPAAPAFLASAELPRPLLRALGASKPAADWRMVIPGVRAVDVAIDASAGAPDATVRVIAFKGGVTIPLHDHGGPEHIVVFTGALEEKGRRFARGDISIRVSGERHEQRAARRRALHRAGRQRRQAAAADVARPPAARAVAAQLAADPDRRPGCTWGGGSR